MKPLQIKGEIYSVSNEAHSYRARLIVEDTINPKGDITIKVPISKEQYEEILPLVDKRGSNGIEVIIEIRNNS